MAGTITSNVARSAAGTIKLILQLVGFVALVLAMFLLPDLKIDRFGSFWSWVIWVAGVIVYEWLIHMIYKSKSKAVVGEQP
jgi:uncharacterized membrane protein YbhN (UPF0104 family)